MLLGLLGSVKVKLGLIVRAFGDFYLTNVAALLLHTVSSSSPAGFDIDGDGFGDVIDALMTVDDGLSQTWIVDSGASFHVTLCLECFATYETGNLGKVCLGNNHACAIEGIGTMHLTLDMILYICIYLCKARIYLILQIQESFSTICQKYTCPNKIQIILSTTI